MRDSIVWRRSVPVRREVGDDPHGVAQHKARVGGLYGAVAVHVRHGPHDLGGDLQLYGVAQHHTGVCGGDHAVKVGIAEDVIPAGGMVVLFPESLSVDPKVGEAGLRKRYGLAEDVLVKFYSGKLSNRGETIAVKKPYFYQKDASNPLNDQWYYDWSDATLYSDKWSGNGIDYKRADGYGYSLQRKDISTMGYEASAWTTDKPTPGK